MKTRVLAPAAAPLSLRDLCSGARGLLAPHPDDGAVEKELRDVLRARHVFLVSSGRAALTVILKSLQRLSPRRRVVLPAYTCFSVPAAVVKAGLEITLCDIDPVTLDFDFASLETLVRESQPLCVVSTHLFGMQADVSRAAALCRRHGAFVIDDAAQSFGTMTPDGALGTLGDVGFYSFGRGKSVTCVRGGAIVTNSEAIARELAVEYSALQPASMQGRIVTLLEAVALATLIQPSLYWMPASLPWLRLGETEYSTAFPVERMSGVETGLLRRWRERLDVSNDARVSRTASFRARLGVKNLQPQAPCIRMPIVCASRGERDRLYGESQRRGLGFSLMYPSAVNAIPELRARFAGQHFPNAERLAECLLTVPVHPLVSDDDRARIETLLSDARLWGEC